MENGICHLVLNARKKLDNRKSRNTLCIENGIELSYPIDSFALQSESRL